MVTASIGQDFYKTELTASGHSLLADESVQAGGADSGPVPGEFVQMGLASCTAITLRMYANRKNYLVERIKVEVSEEKIENTTIFLRTIFIEGPLSNEQRQRMLQIAEKCPVHKTLTNPIEIKTQLL
jgi:putative redox protein